MEKFKSPGIKDIYIEVDGVRLAAIESCEEKIICDSNCIEAIGETQPIAVIKGKMQYEITISKMYLCDPKLDMFGISDFNLVIVKNNHTITYSGCQISSLQQHSSNKSLVENITVIAAKRTESV